jgi:hypothetical protein
MDLRARHAARFGPGPAEAVGAAAKLGRRSEADVGASIDSVEDWLLTSMPVAADRRRDGYQDRSLEPEQRPPGCQPAISPTARYSVYQYMTTVYQGNVSSSLVRVGELFRDAVRLNASGVILVHNHPSGDPTPSPDDLHLTAEALAAGRLLDIALLDHLVIGHDAYVSLRDRGISFDRPGATPRAAD